MKKRLLTMVAVVLTLGAYGQKFDINSLMAKVGPDEPELPPTVKAIDTVNTADKYKKIVLFEDYTWKYIELERPNISDEDFQDAWEQEQIHAYMDVTLASLPAEVDLLLTDSLHGWCCPIQGQVTSGWKFRRHRDHKGTDIALTTGDTIRAAFDGKVRVIREVADAGGYGNLIVVRHANGLETYYAHLSKHLVEENELVKAGEVIGLGGSTGRSTGPHLHFEVRYMGKPFDAERIFDFPNGQLRDTLFTLKKHYFNIYSHYGQTDKESSQTTERVVHIIRSGDTLGAIARKYHTTVARLCSLNGISANKILRLGQRIVVR
ncbi:MAG: peptidoglycan DD-metalloendopeptidase family protein [Bacteroidales bacterium]|nr:peptidoglycan DD-metalloendopeptidase family protein [Bacteroidales bacterium]